MSRQVFRIQKNIMYIQKKALEKEWKPRFNNKNWFIHKKIIGKTLYDLSDVIPKIYADIYTQKDNELFLEPKEQFYEGKVKCSDGLTRDYHFYK